MSFEEKSYYYVQSSYLQNTGRPRGAPPLKNLKNMSEKMKNLKNLNIYVQIFLNFESKHSSALDHHTVPSQRKNLIPDKKRVALRQFFFSKKCEFQS